MSVPQKTGLLFCASCNHMEQPLIGGERVGGPNCQHDKSYLLGDFDLVTGVDNRRFKSCRDMRALGGPCGKQGYLHSRYVPPSPLAPPPDARNCPVPIMPDSPLPSGTDGSGYRSGENGKANSRSRQ